MYYEISVSKLLDKKENGISFMKKIFVSADKFYIIKGIMSHQCIKFLAAVDYSFPKTC